LGIEVGRTFDWKDYKISKQLELKCIPFFFLQASHAPCNRLFLGGRDERSFSAMMSMSKRWKSRASVVSFDTFAIMLLTKAARVVRPISSHRFGLFSSRAIRSLPPTAFRSMSSTHAGESTLRPEPDRVLQDIADYVHGYNIKSDLAFETARLCLIDTIGCGLEALRFPECTKLLGPVVEGTIVPNGLNFYI
jgi:hypothetical protein